MNKIELILRQVAVEKEEESDWGDVWDYVLKSQLQSDVMYTGSMTFGPNFNPRPESVQIMQQPKHLESNELEEQARKRMDNYATVAHRQLADQVREQHPLHEPHDLPQDMEITPDVTEDSNNVNLDIPLNDEHISDWSTRTNRLSSLDKDTITNLMHGAVQLIDETDQDPTKLTSTNLMHKILESYNVHLMDRSRSEVMFTEIQANTNSLSQKMKGMGYQLIYDHRFLPFIQSKLSTSRTILRCTSEGLDQLEVGSAVNFAKLKTVKIQVDADNTRDIKVFRKTGDLWRMMFANVQNGKVFEEIVHLTAIFIEYYADKLAQKDMVYPTYSQLMEDQSPEKWRSDRTLHPFYPPFKQTKKEHYDVEFTKPNFEQKKRAYEAVLTWHCLIALTISYMKHDAQMMKGVNATELTLEYLNCDAVQMLLKCPATISSGAAYFDKFADCPLLCQYGEIGGLPAANEDYMLKPENYLAVQDAFKGGMVIQHMETTLDQTRHTNPDEGDGLWKMIHEFFLLVSYPLALLSLFWHG